MDNFDIDFPQLNLPEVNFRIRKSEKQRTEIFDQFRKKYVVLTPEEWVRQHFIHYLVSDCKYPANLIAVEQGIKRNGVIERADIVVFSKNLNPWMIVECKAANVPLTQAVFEQAARYNLKLGVEYLAITNGIKLMAAQVNLETGKVILLNALPSINL